MGRYQSDTDARKRDYQAIFDRYCSAHEAFDKTTFYDFVQKYIAEIYEMPRAKEEGKTRQQWLRGEEIKRAEKTKRRVIKTAPTVQTFGPKIEKDFEWQDEQCPHCLSKITVIKAFQEYTRLLEGMIRENIGGEKLPERPLALKGL